MATAMTGKFFPWRGRVLTAADVLNLEVRKKTLI